MKANELNCKDIMVGDWVIPHFDSTLEPSKIVGIHYNSYKGKDYEDWVDCEVWDELSLSDIEPIPLTPEILEKIGFETWQDNFVYDNEDIGLIITFHPKETNYTNGTYDYIDIEKGCVTITEMPVEFVHELQHALRLCEIEKIIEL